MPRTSAIPRATELAALETVQDRVESLAEFTLRLTPKYKKIPAHLQPIIRILEETRKREVFATISEPPRWGKTETVAHGLAYRCVYDPACLNFYATFGSELSHATSRRVRDLVREAKVPLSPEAQSVNDWRTTLNGGLKSTSTGGDITGRGCNSGLIVCDDIVKGRDQAESKLNRDRAWDWLRDDVMSRLQPGASLIVNGTRWHEDDPIGRIKNDPMGLPWIHIEIPAVIGLDGKAADELKDPHARSAWPEGGYTMERLAAIRARGEYGWWSLYQQQPFPRGGGMFKRDSFHIVDQAPPGGTAARGWDLAASTNRDSAATAGVKLRLLDGKIYVEDVAWIQGTPHEVEQLIVGTAVRDGASVTQDLPQDPGQAGKAQKSYLASRLQGYTALFTPESGSKELRAEPFAAQAQAGNVYLVRAPWNDPFLAELESFPSGRMKDRVDAASRAYARLVTADQDIWMGGGYTG